MTDNNQPIDPQSDEIRLSGELKDILVKSYCFLNGCKAKDIHEDSLVAQEVNEVTDKFLAWHETEKQKTYADGFINGAKFELLELLNNAAYASRKTVDTKVIIGRLGSVNEGHSELNKSKGGKI